jgi:hypothetical protein
VTLIS